MRRQILLFWIGVTMLTPALATAAPGQRLEAKHILSMVKLGMREAVILQTVRAARTWPRLRVIDVVALHRAGATPRLIDALLRRSRVQIRMAKLSSRSRFRVAKPVEHPWVAAERRLDRARRLRAARLRAGALKARLAAERARAKARAARERRDAQLRAEDQRSSG